MPHAPILNLGARWRAQDVWWNSAPESAKLLGVQAGALRGPRVNFAQQSGIYVLYAGFSPIYVGQANKTLFARLKGHYLGDDLAGRWDRFTWFGFRKVVGGDEPRLSRPDTDFTITSSQLRDHLEAMMIHAFEPPLNGQEGRFGKRVVRYRQVRDERLGPEDRDLLEAMAQAGGLLPPGKRITKRGWGDT